MPPAKHGVELDSQLFYIASMPNSIRHLFLVSTSLLTASAFYVKPRVYGLCLHINKGPRIMSGVTDKNINQNHPYPQHVVPKNLILAFMCYHSSTPSKKKLKEAFPKHHVDWDGNLYAPEGQYYHVSGFVRPWLPVTLNATPENIGLARWKLIPFWVKDEEGAGKYANTLNAEGESVFEKASYKPYIKKNRGLLYVDGFFEPHKVKGVKETENYFLHLPEKAIFTLGIVWAEFNGYPTFSILTTEANPQLAEIHNEKKRMPFVVDPADREAWLQASDPVDIKQLIRPWDGEFLAHRTARVTAIRGTDTNVPEIQHEV